MAIAHLFKCSDGALYDTREAHWERNPLRTNYAHTHRDINSTADFKATVRNGAFAWPGGYPLYFICDDGGALCFDCARSCAREIIDAIHTRSRGGWRVVGCDINYEDEICCDHCSKDIDAAYSE